MSRPVTTVVLACALALSAAACSAAPASGPPSNPASSATAAPVAAEHNAADVAFAQMMIPHHAQAVAMATLASTRASSTRIVDFAGRIANAQGPEIGRMNAMLTAWGAPVVSPDDATMSHDMPGMMTAGEISQLSAASGPAFDRAFLQMMTAHHSGAITMAGRELAQGLNPQATALAGSIIADQQLEIAEMRSLLGAA